MRILQEYSHQNGLEYLLVHKPNLWKEILRVINSVNAEECRTKASKEKRVVGKLRYSSILMNDAIKVGLEAAGGWVGGRGSYGVPQDAKLIRRAMAAGGQKTDIDAANVKSIRSYRQTDFAKERVAVEVQIGKHASDVFDLFVKHMALFLRDVIDVGVEILPMKELQEGMSSGVAYYECELYNLIREGRGVPAVPLVLVGVAP